MKRIPLYIQHTVEAKRWRLQQQWCLGNAVWLITASSEQTQELFWVRWFTHTAATDTEPAPRCCCCCFCKKYANKVSRLTPPESGWRKQEGVQHRAPGQSHHQNGSIDKNKKTLAGGMHTFTQCPTISRNKAEGVEVAQRCSGSGSEAGVSASVMADHTPPRDGCRGKSRWQMCCAAGTQVQSDLMSKGGRAD